MATKLPLVPVAMIGSAALALMTFAPGLSAKPRLQTGPDAEVTFDGLHRVDKTVMSAAWVKPDLDLRVYEKLMLVGAGITYAPLDEEGERWWPGRSDVTEFPINEEARERFREEVSTAFVEGLSDIEGYEIVTEPGPQTLMLVAGVIDVMSRVPPADECVGRCDIYLTDVGEATLVIELRDSVTGEVLVRAADRRAAEAAFPIDASSVTVWPEVRRLASTWARMVRKRLEDFETIDDLG